MEVLVVVDEVVVGGRVDVVEEVVDEVVVVERVVVVVIEVVVEAVVVVDDVVDVLVVVQNVICPDAVGLGVCDILVPSPGAPGQSAPYVAGTVFPMHPLGIAGIIHAPDTLA